MEDIQAIENKLTLGTYVDGEETKEYATVKDYVEAAIAALSIGDYAKAADLTALADRVAELEAKLAVYSHLAQAADDVRLGRVQDADDAYDDIIAELESLDL